MELPNDLRFAPFYQPYIAPDPAPEYERTPEVIEAEIKALEVAMEKLALITLKYRYRYSIKGIRELNCIERNTETRNRISDSRKRFYGWSHL